MVAAVPILAAEPGFTVGVADSTEAAVSTAAVASTVEGGAPISGSSTTSFCLAVSITASASIASPITAVGLERLTVTNNNVFTRLTLAEEAIIAMRDLASPVSAFVRERCVVGLDHQIRTDDLYAAYKLWAEDAGHAKKTSQTFGRDLRAVIPALSVQRPRDHPDRHRIYVGIDARKAE